MSAGIRVLTALLFASAAALLAFGLALPSVRILVLAAALEAALFAAVWLLWRPTAFEVGPEGIAVRFPLRTRRLPGSELAGARTLDGATFRREFGGAIRIGVGGLFGGFGWLWTRGRGRVDFYVSRTDGLLLVERRGGPPLLVSPSDPEGTARALNTLHGGERA